MRNGKTLLHRVCVSLAAAAAIFGVAGMSWAAGGGAETVRSADIILIDTVAKFRPLENAKAVFRHDLHTGALAARGKDCSVCHMTAEGGKMSTKFMRLEDKDADSLKRLYHEKCISCHTAAAKDAKAAKAGQKKDAGGGARSAPVEGECKRCHDAGGRYIPTREASSFGAAVHAKHVDSPLVKAIKKDGSGAQNCVACHHNAAPGKEDSCRLCHVRGYGIRPWYSEVGHGFCLDCHQDAREQGKAAPQNCAGCHGGEAGKKDVKDTPRLMRGQPDKTLIFPASETMTPAAAMKPAFFDHQGHEGKIDSCRSCHHVRIGTCTGCHTAEGAKAGYNVNLDRAMHDEKSGRSCIGCHNQRLKAPECAGCHGFVKPVRGKDFCNVCHGEVAGLDDKSFAAGIAGALPAADKAELAAAAARQPAGDPDTGGVPDVVSIGAIKEQYEANEFNHKAHLEDYIMGTVSGDRLAAAFHTDTATLCAGCHHNSPPSMNPPKCSSCHGKTIDARFPERPTLKSAYHMLCMGCHDRMKVEPVAKTDCTACHAQAKK